MYQYHKLRPARPLVWLRCSKKKATKYRKKTLLLIILIERKRCCVERSRSNWSNITNKMITNKWRRRHGMNGTSVQDMHKFSNEITRQFWRIRQYVITNQMNHLYTEFSVCVCVTVAYYVTQLSVDCHLPSHEHNSVLHLSAVTWQRGTNYLVESNWIFSH